MLATTVAAMILLFNKFRAGPGRNPTLLAADVVMMAITAYLVFAALRTLAGLVRRARTVAEPSGD